jgi:ethanolaminephosphotransferase
MNVMNVRRERGQDTIKPLYGLLPIFATWILIPVYLHLQPIILHQHLIPFIFYVGLINAYSVGQMITAHLTKSKFPYDNILVLPLMWGVIDSVGPLTGAWPSALGSGTYQVAFVFMCLGLGIGVYGSFVVCRIPLEDDSLGKLR